jgi:hypothetical protein
MSKISCNNLVVSLKLTTHARHSDGVPQLARAKGRRSLSLAKRGFCGSALNAQRPSPFQAMADANRFVEAKMRLPRLSSMWAAFLCQLVSLHEQRTCAFRRPISCLVRFAYVFMGPDKEGRHRFRSCQILEYFKLGTGVASFYNLWSTFGSMIGQGYGVLVRKLERSSGEKARSIFSLLLLRCQGLKAVGGLNPTVESLAAFPL